MKWFRKAAKYNVIKKEKLSDNRVRSTYYEDEFASIWMLPGSNGVELGAFTKKFYYHGDTADIMNAFRDKFGDDTFDSKNDALQMIEKWIDWYNPPSSCWIYCQSAGNPNARLNDDPG